MWFLTIDKITGVGNYPFIIGGFGMIDNKDLERDIKLSGLKLKYIADYLDISYVTLRRKLNGESAWKYEEMEKIKKLFGYKV